MTREEAIKIVQSATVWTAEERDALAMLIPELAESEDERIRKGMIYEIKAILRGEDLGFPPQDVLESRLAYLEKQKDIDKMIVVSPEVWDKAIADAYENGKKDGEKQKEQKPAEWSEKYIADIFEKVGLAKIVREQGNDELTNALQDAMLELSKVGNVEWNEEDVKRLYSIGTQIGFLKGKYPECQKDIDWLHGLAEKMGFHKCKIGEIITEWKKEDIDDKMLSKSKQEWSSSCYHTPNGDSE